MYSMCIQVSEIYCYNGAGSLTYLFIYLFTIFMVFGRGFPQRLDSTNGNPLKGKR